MVAQQHISTSDYMYSDIGILTREVDMSVPVLTDANAAPTPSPTDALQVKPTSANIFQPTAGISPVDPTAPVRYMVYCERMECLRTALEGLLIAKGMMVTDAQNTVTKWVRTAKGRTTAKAVAAAYGFDYLKADWSKP